MYLLWREKMQYKGFKTMKRVAAVMISAAMMLADIQGVSAAEYGQVSETETEKADLPEDTAQTDVNEGQPAEDLDAEKKVPETVETMQAEIVETVQSESVETELKESETTEFEKDASAQVTADETQSKMPETDIDEVQSEMPETNLDETPESENVFLSGVDDSEAASEIAVDEEIVASNENAIQFKVYGDESNELIKKAAISVNEPVTIEAVFGITPPAGAKVQWASSKSDYVKVTERTDIVGTNAIMLEGLKPTTTLEDSVKVTCILIYDENGKQTMLTGILSVTVKPLAESVSIRIGQSDATGKVAVYDIETNRFIAIDSNKLQQPVENFSALIYPKDANQKVTWKSSNTSIMSFEDENSGIVKGMGAGEATVTATATDGSKVEGSVRVKARRVIQGLSFTAKTAEKNGTELLPDENGRIEITAGTSIYLEPTYKPADATERLISWSNDNKNAIDITTNTSTNVAKVTAKNVASDTEVLLTARTTDMSEISCEVKLVIKPKVEKIKIYPLDAAGNPDLDNCVSGKSIGVDPDDPNSVNTYVLKAFNEPENASQKVKWEISNDKVAEIETLSDNTCRVTAKANGTATITATAIDGSKTTAAVAFNVVALVKEVTISGSDMVMRGKTIKLTAAVIPQSITNIKFKWESMTPEIASVNASTGEVTGKKWGVAIITAKAMDGSNQFGSHAVKVTDPTKTFEIIDSKENNITGKMVGIDPDPVADANGNVPEPTYTAAVKILPDTACQEVEWKSSNEKIVTVETVDNHAVITAKALGRATVTANAVDGSGKTASIQVNVNALAKTVTVTGGHYVAKDMTLQLKAEVGDKDAANKSVIWKSSAPKIAEVDETGLVTAIGKDGKTMITAEAADGGGAKAEYYVYVVNQKNKVDITTDNNVYQIKIDKNNNKSMEVDLSGKESVSIDFRAVLEGGSAERDNVPMDVKWSTSSKSIASVEADPDNSKTGHVTIYKKGTVKITAASVEGFGTSKTITIKVTNDNPWVTITGPGNRLARGKKMKLSVNGGVLVDWETSSEEVAKVNNKGQVTADRYEDGQVIITAKAVDGTFSGTYAIEVGEPAESVGLMINNTPLEPKEKVGVDIINGYNGNKEIRLSANLNFMDGSTETDSSNVTWKSSNKAVGTIDEYGNVELKKNGNVTFTATATDGTNKKGKVTLVVTKQVTSMEPAGGGEVCVGLKKSVQLNVNYRPLTATKRKAVWESDNPEAVSVGKNNGKVTGKIADEYATITARAADNGAVYCTFTVYVTSPVSKVEVVKAAGGNGYQSVLGIDLSKTTVEPLQLAADLYAKEDGELSYLAEQPVTWTSSNKSIATVDENGVVTGHKNGEVTITAKATDGSKKSGKVKVYCGKLITDIVVSDKISSGVSLNRRSKKTIELADKLTIVPATATNRKLTYTTDDKKVATVNANGKVTAKGEGVAVITVTPKDGSGIIRQIYVTVE